MRCEQGRSPDQFQSHIEVEVVLVDIHAQAFQSAEGSMAFIAVVNRGFHTHGFKQADTAHTEEHLLFDAHLAVAAIESASDATVFGRVLFDIGVQKVKSYPTHIDTPCLGIDRAAWEGDAHHHPFAILVEDRLQRQLRKLLRNIIGLLFSRNCDFLGKVAITVQQSDAHHIGVGIRGLLHVVASKDTKAARINLKALHQTVFHAEIGDEVLLLGRLRHIRLKLVVHLVQAFDEFLIVLKISDLLYGKAFHQGDGVLLRCLPSLRVDGLKKFNGIHIPAPPDVA